MNITKALEEYIYYLEMYQKAVQDNPTEELEKQKQSLEEYKENPEDFTYNHLKHYRIKLAISIAEIDAKLNEIYEILEYHKVIVSEKYKDLLNRFNISNSKMCELLEKQTGKKWQTKTLEGKFSNQYTFHIFGNILVNEDSEYFGEENKVQVSSLDDFNEKNNLIKGRIVAYSDGNDKRPSASSIDTTNNNWLHYYLEQKGLIPNFININYKNRVSENKPYKKCILDTIDQYIYKNSPNMESQEGM